MLAVIILAAGESTRMGKPKALVKFREQSFLETVISNFHKAGVEQILVVLGFAANQIFATMKMHPMQVVINKKYPLGQFSSFQTGVQKLGSNIDGTFLSLVDQPQIGVHVINKMVKAFQNNSDKIILPVYRGKRGHPAIFPKTFFPKILSSPATNSAADLIHKHPKQIYEMEVDDECILWNINTKQDLEAVRKKFSI
ncbi:MAG: NTP transferase domain-containing protein [bacterium]